jgi:1,4-alpha-glucan branching enzyme
LPDRDPFEPQLVDHPTAAAIANGEHLDPFAVLGPHKAVATGRVIRAFLPGARKVVAFARGGDNEVLCELHEVAVPGFFAGRPNKDEPYVLRIEWPDFVQATEDPYSFGIVLGDLDLHLFGEGSHWKLAQNIGAAPIEVDGIPGVRFAVWAPNARRVAVVGDFNAWDGRRHPMRLRREAGLWEIFIPRLGAGERYKFHITDRDGNVLPLKADPLARATEAPPATASIVANDLDFAWHDREWIARRAGAQASDRPISIYEVHAGSWMRPENDRRAILSWDDLAERLIPYVRESGFTHVEFMPIMEHPFVGSWGYQPLAQFAPSARFGPAEGFARLVDACHRANIGVILDWVPAHFPTDSHGLARFDGTALYEHADPREGFHPDWNTYVFNLGRREVQEFLIASALYWLETFHVDGLRVDAVASMLYRDYSRKEGEWVPNRHGGRENLESIAFLTRLNSIVRERVPGAITIAEESTAWPGVTAPSEEGGLGFSYKWNMGWMHDTLQFLSRDSIHRPWHHHEWTFGLLYAFSERFILPLSHDEVVHGKGSLNRRVPGGESDKLATLRAYFTFMWTHPGKKLLFMGGELGQPREWNHDGEIDWGLLAHEGHAGLKRLVADLNHLYRNEPALHERDTEAGGFEWIVNDDSKNSVFVYLRRGRDGIPIVVAVNMTPVGRDKYRIGVPLAGPLREVLNSDAAIYGGANRGNLGGVLAVDEPSHGRENSTELYLPPLSAIILKPDA